MRVSPLYVGAVITVMIAYFVYSLLISYEHCGLAFLPQQLRWINKETPGMVMI